MPALLPPAEHAPAALTKSTATQSSTCWARGARVTAAAQDADQRADVPVVEHVQELVALEVGGHALWVQQAAQHLQSPLLQAPLAPLPERPARLRRSAE